MPNKWLTYIFQQNNVNSIWVKKGQKCDFHVSEFCKRYSTRTQCSPRKINQPLIALESTLLNVIIETEQRLLQLH